MQNRYEAWFLALKAAKIIVAETTLNPNAPLEDNEWWEFMRFKGVGNQIKQFFDKNPREKDALHKQFMKSNDRLSYFDFGQFLIRANI